MRKPNFFIVGAARSGTTSLWQYLGNHPSIFMPADELEKEPSFFTNEVKTGYGTLESYLSIFERAGQGKEWLGEASVAYLTDASSAARIQEFDPSARIIILLRNPADRAYSLYRWMVQDGYEYINSFEEALELEEDRAKDRESNWWKPNYYWGYLYFRSGLYFEQVKRYLDRFGKNVLIVKFEDLVKAPETSLAKVCAFFDLIPVETSFPRHNTSRAVRSAKIQFVLRKLILRIIQENKKGVPLSAIADCVASVFREIEGKLSQVAPLSDDERAVGARIVGQIEDNFRASAQEFPYRDIKHKAKRDALMSLGYLQQKPAPRADGTRRRLLAQYQEDILKLSDLTGKYFADWLT